MPPPSNSWADAGSFRGWHASPAYHHSHRGNPKGVKFDRSFTQITVLDRFDADVLPMCEERDQLKPGDGDRETVADYLRENSFFLSHGCCLEGAAALPADLQFTPSAN